MHPQHDDGVAKELETYIQHGLEKSLYSLNLEFREMFDLHVSMIISQMIFAYK